MSRPPAERQIKTLKIIVIAVTAVCVTVTGVAAFLAIRLMTVKTAPIDVVQTFAVTTAAQTAAALPTTEAPTTEAPATVAPATEAPQTAAPIVIVVTEPQPEPPTAFGSYLIWLNEGVLVYETPDSSAAVTYVIDISTQYTIVAEAVDASGNRWGKLKSGIGWVLL